MVVITETRYGGTYEGGAWAAFAVAEPSSVPEDAFSGDAMAFDWWDEPTVPVGTGESPDGALERLNLLLARDRYDPGTGIFAVDEPVVVVRSVPDAWWGQGVGRVVGVEHRPSRPFVGGLRGQCVYAVCFEDEQVVKVPERYLRPAPEADGP